jgi:hypothetical protein
MAKFKKPKKVVFQEPTIQEIVEMEIEVKDPATGKMIKQKVKVKKLKPVLKEEFKEINVNSLIKELDKDSLEEETLEEEID